MKNENVNIGLLIEQKMNELGVNKSELARRLGISNQYISQLLKKTSIDTDRLITICKALDFDFFTYYRKEEETPSAPAAGSTSVLSHNYIEGDGNLSGNQILSPGVPVAAADGDGDDSPAVLRERVKALQQLLDEKERTIKILLDKKRNE